jgi:hypothetical protein
MIYDLLLLWDLVLLKREILEQMDLRYQEAISKYHHMKYRSDSFQLRGL